MLRIITEGNDKAFLDKYIRLKLLKREGVDFTVLSAGGWTTLDLHSPELEKYNDARDKICLIFDADTTANNGGFALRIAALQAKIAEISAKIWEAT